MKRRNGYTYSREPKKRKKLPEPPDSVLLNHGYFPRHDSEGMKKAVRRAMGPAKADLYFKILKQFFCAKLSKWELDYMFREKIGVQYVGVHNEFLTKILYNARCHEPPDLRQGDTRQRQSSLPPEPAEIPPAPDPRKKKKRPRLIAQPRASGTPSRTNGTLPKPPRPRKKPKLPPAKPPFILKSLPPPKIAPHISWPTHKRKWLPKGDLPKAYELHSRIEMNCKSNKLKMDARVPLLVRAAMNAHLARILRKIPVRKLSECWCDRLEESGRLHLKVEIFRKHWTTCRKRNTVGIREVQSQDYHWLKGKPSI